MAVKKIGIVIQARVNSTRLRGKVVEPFYNGKSILEIIIEKFIDNKFDIPIIIASSNNVENDIIEEVALKYNIETFRGQEENVLSRFVSICEKHKFTHVIRICADNPFLYECFFEELVIRGLENNYDYLSFYTSKRVPAIRTHLGLFTEWVSAKALQEINVHTEMKIYQEHVTNFIYSNPNLFEIGKMILPNYLDQNLNLRFTIDTINDFKTMKDLYLTWKEGNIESIEGLVKLVKSDKRILESMNNEIVNNTK